MIAELTSSSLTLSSPLTDRTNSPNMSFIQAFLQQTVYLGMPDESVSNFLALF